MKARKTLTLLLAALALTACKYDDSALWEQLDQNKEYIAATERIAALEENRTSCIHVVHWPDHRHMPGHRSARIGRISFQ